MCLHPKNQAQTVWTIADFVSSWSNVVVSLFKYGELPDGPMAPPHYDDPWLDDEEEDQQQPAARARKKGGRGLPAASGDVKLPLQLGQHLTGAAIPGCVYAVSHQATAASDSHSRQPVVQQLKGAAVPFRSADIRPH
jgi:hypothetical protein